MLAYHWIDGLIMGACILAVFGAGLVMSFLIDLYHEIIGGRKDGSIESRKHRKAESTEAGESKDQ